MAFIVIIGSSSLRRTLGCWAVAAPVSAAARLQSDLTSWRRTAVERWVRTHGVLLLSYYSIGVLAYACLLYTSPSPRD